MDSYAWIGDTEFEPTITYQPAEGGVDAMDAGIPDTDTLAKIGIDNAAKAETSGYDGFGYVPDTYEDVAGGSDLKDNGTSLEALLAAQRKEDALGDQTKSLSIDEVLKKYGISDPKVLSSLITLGSGMLSGAAKGKAQEKAWKREEDIIAKERARRDAYSKPGQVYSMNFKPQATGLLSSVKK